MLGTMRPDVYYSFDIEADGPIPGPYSMISFGATIAGTFDGSTFVAMDPAATTFYRELRPISDEYVPEALAVSGLDRARLLREGTEATEAMTQLSTWVTETAGGGKPIAA